MAEFELIQVHIIDALHSLWHLPLDFHGDILLFIEKGGFRSLPSVKGNHLVMKAYGQPLVHALTGFDTEFEGLVRLEIHDGELARVEFCGDNLKSNQQFNEAFKAWLPLWSENERARLKSQGVANQLSFEMHQQMKISEKLDRRTGVLKPMEHTFISWAFQQITGVNGYTGWVTIRSRDGGIMSTTPPMQPSANRQKIKMALKNILPQQGKAETKFYLNRGLPNPK